MARTKIITGLDVGTSAIKALVAAKNPDSFDLEILGKAEIPSFGMRKGIVDSIDEISKNIARVLTQVQADVGQKLDDVYTNIGGNRMCSVISRGSVIVSRADQRISEEDINRVMQTTQAFSLPSNKEILDIFPREFIVDGEGQIKNPLNMQGLRLEAEALALCVFSPHLKNLTAAVLNAGFQISNIVPSILASSRAVLTPQQKELGVCLLDIGAGTCGMAVYEEGDLAHLAVFPIGSANITNDLAIGLRTDIEIAERIKREFGACLLRGSKKEKIELLSGSGNSEFLTFSHKMLGNIIEPRVSEIFDLVQQELKKVHLRTMLPAGIVLTGGGAKLPKIAELAKKELKLPARVAFPRGQGWQGLEEDPAWSTCWGLVLEGADIEKDENWMKKSLPQVLGPGLRIKFKKIFKTFLP